MGSADGPLAARESRESQTRASEQRLEQGPSTPASLLVSLQHTLDNCFDLTHFHKKILSFALPIKKPPFLQVKSRFPEIHVVGLLWRARKEAFASLQPTATKQPSEQGSCRKRRWNGWKERRKSKIYTSFQLHQHVGVACNRLIGIPCGIASFNSSFPLETPTRLPGLATCQKRTGSPSVKGKQTVKKQCSKARRYCNSEDCFIIIGTRGRRRRLCSASRHRRIEIPISSRSCLAQLSFQPNRLPVALIPSNSDRKIAGRDTRGSHNPALMHQAVTLA